MTKEQEEAIEYLEESVLIYKNTIPKISKSIETVLSMLKEKDRQIDLMSEELIGVPIDNKNLDWEHPYRRDDFIFLNSKEEIKQYFKRKSTNNG